MKNKKITIDDIFEKDFLSKLESEYKRIEKLIEAYKAVKNVCILSDSIIDVFNKFASIGKQYPTGGVVMKEENKTFNHAKLRDLTESIKNKDIEKEDLKKMNIEIAKTLLENEGYTFFKIKDLTIEILYDLMLKIKGNIRF